MGGFRVIVGVIASSIVLSLTAGAAVALTSGAVAYEAGTHAKPPYVFLTVSHGKVTKIRWAIRETCDGAPPLSPFTSRREKLNAPIKHGHFSKTVHYSLPGSPVAQSTGTTTVSGTISGHSVTVKVRDEQDLASYNPCTGSHTFKATKATKFR
jgi:hypothetical protein